MGTASARAVERGFPQCFSFWSTWGEYGFEVVSHIILGLPHENDESIKKTAKFTNNLGLDGIKVHQLMVLKDTALVDHFQAGKLQILGLDEYLRRLKILLGHLDKEIVIHRLYGDAPKNELIAPLWCLNKTGLQDIILNHFVDIDFYQGKFLL